MFCHSRRMGTKTVYLGQTQKMRERLPDSKRQDYDGRVHTLVSMPGINEKKKFIPRWQTSEE